jgi:hypothetical protein
MFYPAAIRSFASDNTFPLIKEQIHAPVSIILLDKSMDCFNKKLIDS